MDLALFAGCGLNHRTGFRPLLPQQMTHEALDTLIATGKAVAIDQILPDALEPAPVI